jgi:hypothetical protein
MAQKCPNCNATLSASDVAGGWCESCGKKLPPSLAPSLPVKGETAPPTESGGGVTLSGVFWTAVLLIAGFFLIDRGRRQFEMLQKAGSDPTPVELVELESGKPLPQTYVRLGKHVRLYPLSVYTTRKSQAAVADPDVTTVLTPALSTGNPAMREGGSDKDLKAAKLRVIIKTDRFKKRSGIPTVVKVEQEVTGLVVSEVNRLDTDERNLLKDAFSETDLRDVLIIEEGSKPYSLGWPVLEIVIGAGMMLFAGWLVVRAVRGFFGRG